MYRHGKSRLSLFRKVDLSRQTICDFQLFHAMVQWRVLNCESVFPRVLSYQNSFLSSKFVVIREHFVTLKPLACNGYRSKKGVQSTRLFIRNVLKLLHLASCPLCKATGIGRTLSIFSCFSSIVKATLGRFSRFLRFLRSIPFWTGLRNRP